MVRLHLKKCALFLDFEVFGRRCRQPKMTWRKYVVKQVDKIGLKKGDAIDIPKWHDAVNKLSRSMR